jgi:hypothetical protein
VEQERENENAPTEAGAEVSTHEAAIPPQGGAEGKVVKGPALPAGAFH